MLSLYPDIKPFAAHSLMVDEVLTLHVEECGNPEGLPVVFVHGGPGSGCEPNHRRFFDPNVYRIVLFDQRGAWRSTLGLVYAETHPTRVLVLILRGIFLCAPWEIRWFYQEGANRLFPDYWEDYLKPVPAEERHEMVEAYYRLLTGSNEIA